MKTKLVNETLNEEYQEMNDNMFDGMDIGPRSIIEKWFKEWAPKAEYTIDDNLNIKVDGYLQLWYLEVTWIPDNLKVGGSLHLKYTKITKLPNGLKVGSWLDIRGTKITKLSDDLEVKISKCVCLNFFSLDVKFSIAILPDIPR